MTCFQLFWANVAIVALLQLSQAVDQLLLAIPWGSENFWFVEAQRASKELEQIAEGVKWVRTQAKNI